MSTASTSAPAAAAITTAMRPTRPGDRVGGHQHARAQPTTGANIRVSVPTYTRERSAVRCVSTSIQMAEIAAIAAAAQPTVGRRRHPLPPATFTTPATTIGHTA